VLDPQIIFAGVLNGLLAGGIYVLVAVGLTLIYGVLHIINFAHGSLLMLAMYAVLFLWRLLGIDPYIALPIEVGGAFVVGFVLYRGLIGRYSHGKDENILLITLGVSIVADNAALLFFGGDTETISVKYGGEIIQIGAAFLPLPKVVSFVASLVICGLIGLYMAKSDTGKAIRAVAKERHGARLVGIDVEHIFATSYGIGIACLGARATLSCWSPSPSSCWAAWGASWAQRSAAFSLASPNRWAVSSLASSSARSASR
jgi:branched-chain amino acid transport system permease protein